MNHEKIQNRGNAMLNQVDNSLKLSKQKKKENNGVAPTVVQLREHVMLV
jgi:hypothetical protein